MKKCFFILLFLYGMGVTMVEAQNPIPSYSVPVYNIENFQEQLKTLSTKENTRGKRAVVVTTHAPSTSVATIYVYSLDNQDILGPFTVYGGETISVEIDSREWGVVVESADHITVDVWIEEGA